MVVGVAGGVIGVVEVGRDSQEEVVGGGGGGDEGREQDGEFTEGKMRGLLKVHFPVPG